MKENKQLSVLENLESAKQYRRWLISLSSELFKDEVFELGSGIGLYAREILAADYTKQISKYHVTEIDDDSLEILHERFKREERVEIHNLNLELPMNLNANSFVSWNVLEHINDDIAALKLANRVCTPGSSVFALVPAMPFAYSRFDRELNHFRRYTKKELLSKAKLAGLKEVEVQYINGIGILNWYIFVKILNLRPKNNILLKVYDQLVVPVQMQIERKLVLPFGQSLVLRAKTT
jgi:SAM-dependent methyltransferase